MGLVVTRDNLNDGFQYQIVRTNNTDAKLIATLRNWAPAAIEALSNCSTVLEKVGCSCTFVADIRCLCDRCEAIVSLDKASKEPGR